MATTGLRARFARLIGRLFGRPARRTVGRPARRSDPGDFRGVPKISYRPNPGNGKVADPGEIVWTWVPFEEDHSQGKDRPVLVIGHDGPWLLALALTSKDHRGDAVLHPNSRSQWTDIGPGPWDRRGRPSAVRVDRVLRVDPDGIRREGAVLDKRRFNKVASAVRSAG